MDLYDFINHATLGSPNADPNYNQTGASCWGWTDPHSGREFIGKTAPNSYSPILILAASGMFDGTALIEILPTGRMLQLGFLYVTIIDSLLSLLIFAGPLMLLQLQIHFGTKSVLIRISC